MDRAQDEPLFKQGLDGLLEDLTANKTALVERTRRDGGAQDEALRRELQAKVDELNSCAEKLRPHCQEARYAPKLASVSALRAELLEEWLRSIEGLCANLVGANKGAAEAAVASLRACASLTTEESARVGGLETTLREAGQQQEHQVRQLQAAWHDVLAFDCAAPASFKYTGAALRSKLEDMSAHEGLVAGLGQGVLPDSLYRDCLRHLNISMEVWRPLRPFWRPF
jgi:hypothetical protein